jgi:hypothetical protein
MSSRARSGRPPSRAGLSAIDLASAARLLANFVIGTAMAEAGWRKLDDPAVISKAREYVTGLRELYPALASSFVNPAWSDDDLFDHGLNLMLDALMPWLGGRHLRRNPELRLAIASGKLHLSGCGQSNYFQGAA